MIITVGGDIGSGKSTLARMLAEKYGLKYHSVGGIMRALAKEKGVSLLELSAIAEGNSSIDKELDQKQKELCDEDCVMDSRLGAYFLEADFKIWLDVQPEEQARRIAGRDGISVEEAKRQISERRASENGRYKKLYDIDLEDDSVYDLVLDTTDLTKAQMLKKTAEAIEAKGL